MAEYQNLKVNIEDRTAVLTIDHPPANAFDTQTVTDLNDAFDEVTANDTVKVIVITGAGQFFVAGADINEINAIKDADQAYQVVRAGQILFRKIELSKKPVIAAINGRACLGGGNELAMACHIRLAEDSVQFGQPEIKLGIIPGWGGTQRLQRLVGKGNALEIILGGGNIKAQEAYRIGLVNKVVPVGSVVREAKRWAKALSMWGGPALAAALQAVYEGAEMNLDGAIENEARIFASLTQTEDMREGVSAFLEKRRPQFKDR
ncbi:MAG: enoyl-CoA hydratase/isomerase family protein [Anaerolineae bacterium]|nr:enoyl-CoA hydratase/isomerase family protein [Anaerolineae bacterium]